MSNVGAIERITQKRIIKLFKDELGYRNLGNLHGSVNYNINEELLKAFLKKQNYSEELIKNALRNLNKETDLNNAPNLYKANENIYNLLRYGIKVQEDISKSTETVWLIDWKNPEKNDFAIAEEVTVIVSGTQSKRPDLVIYINGIAIGIIELKRSTKDITEGIKQNLINQKRDAISWFFTTIQLVMVGNDTQGLRYGTIETTETYYLEWKEEGGIGDYKLDRHLSLLCEKKRLLEIIHNFIVFDCGVKKICRHNQYFAVKATQDYIKRREGGIIWHTQGSGKSLTMVWLSKWIRENAGKYSKDTGKNFSKTPRVLIITDRIELDEQIQKIYKGVNEKIDRTENSADLVNKLNSAGPWLICSLIHKFGSSADNDLSKKDVDKFVQGIQKSINSNFEAKGDIYVFVDECHRTQSGKLHKAMKKILPNAIFIGFTGTPLLKNDKKNSREIFGDYIHTYKFDEALKDGVVVGLCYQALHIDQKIVSRERIDYYFESETRGISEENKAKIKKKSLINNSSTARLRIIADDILNDMKTRPSLRSGRGNAILVAENIYQACKFYEIFSATDFFKKCAIITSYVPSAQKVKYQESNKGMTKKLFQYSTYRKMLSEFLNKPADEAINCTGEFEQKVKKEFIEQPGKMRLLIVVDKLLTGFDAPSATYLYIDKKMQDHKLFQAVCRVNRLNGEDKKYGYIVDYKNLLNNLGKSLIDYTSGAFNKYDQKDIKDFLKDRLTAAKNYLDEAREAVKALCEKVNPPKDTLAYIRYFCSDDTTNKEALKNNEPLRFDLYKKIRTFMRAYAEISDEMIDAKYSQKESEIIKSEVKYFGIVYIEIKMASGDYVDMKAHEHTILYIFDTFVQADASRELGSFDNCSLTQLIAEQGEEAIKKLPENIRNNPQALVETIENSLYRFIEDQKSINPKYYEKMSKLLDDLIKEQKDEALKYKEYCEFSKKVYNPELSGRYPNTIDNPTKIALFDNLGEDEELTLKVYKAIEESKNPDFREHTFKSRIVLDAITKALEGTNYDVEQIFEIVLNQKDYKQ